MPSFEPGTLKLRAAKSRSPNYLPRFLIGGLVLALVLIGGRFFAVKGWSRPVRIVSGSMANRLIGEHFMVTCADCGFVFRFGVESKPPTDMACCPNCGFERNVPRPDWRGRGDRVMIDRAAYWFDPPPRFAMVAFRDPKQPARQVVKRIVGLPGEQVSIRLGNLYLNDRLLRKSLAEFWRSAILVHDNNHVPQLDRTLPARWRSDESTSWTRIDDTLCYRAPSPPLPAEKAKEDWLTYHHWRCYANPYPRSAEVPVSDNYGYNQGESRELREVVDLIVTCQVKMALNGEIAFRIHDGRDWCSLIWQESYLVVERSNRQLAVGMLKNARTELTEIEFGIVDQQFVCSVNGQEVIRQAYELGDAVFDPIATPVAIGGLQSDLEVMNLKIYRDVYYLDPWGVGQPWSMAAPAGEDEYCVLGDNPPISDDSRRWKKPTLSAHSIIGRVIPLPR